MSDLVRNGELVDALRLSLSSTRGLNLVPEAVRAVLDAEAWRDRAEIRTAARERYGFASFAEFVATPPLDGLGMDAHDIETILRAHDEHDTLRRFKEACSHQGARTDLVNNVHEVERPQGNQRSRALARLHRDRPDLYARVIAGELSAHAAAIEAGFRPRTASVPIDSPEAAVRALLRRFTREQLSAALRAGDD